MSDVIAVGGGHKAGRLTRLFDALVDPKRRERTVLVLLGFYAAVWSVYGAIAKGSQDLHFDMGEMVAWSREVGFGTPKHPPLPAWLVRLWFDVFPLQDWAYYLFAILLATLSLWIAWKVSSRYLDDEKRVVGLALLTLVPFYNFHALKFNANTAMTPAWALATWCFLRSFDSRRPLDAASAGVAAAAAMLSKYWSIFLLAGLGLAALCDPRRGTYFRSAAPWITIAVGLAALAPHLAWLYANDFRPFQYAMDSHPTDTWEALRSGLGYVLGAAGYLAVPALLVAAAARPSWRALIDTAFPHDADRRLVLIAFAAPMGLPILAALAASAEVVSLWAIGGMTLAPIVLLSSPRISIPRPAAERILALAIALPTAALALSPAIAIYIHRQGVPNSATHYRLVAQAAEKAWHETSDRPLRLIGSYNNLLYGTVFYFAERPSTLEIVTPEVTPWTDAARIRREGIVLFCAATDARCIKAMDALAARGPAGKRVEIEVSRTYFGFADPPERYVIVTIPPG
jgi:hypothetical protein